MMRAPLLVVIERDSYQLSLKSEGVLNEGVIQLPPRLRVWDVIDFDIVEDIFGNS